MRVLLTGSEGYIGAVMRPVLQAAGHTVVGLDTGFYRENGHEPPSSAGFWLRKDLRDLTPADLGGFDAVAHLAALSNDPLGKLNPALTFEINHHATVRLAQMAKAAGVRRFLYASTCSVYGVASQAELATEDAPLRPLTPYAISKVRAEEDLDALADDSFSPVFLRNATAYGWSARFRADLVLNNLACWAFTSGEIRILSDGTPWRPIVHIRDISNAFCAALSAPREAILRQAFNVGIASENYQVMDLAAIVQEGFPGCRLVYAGDGSPDPRSYRVDFSKITRALPDFCPQWDARRGVQELRLAYQRVAMQPGEFDGPRYTRLARLKQLIDSGQLDETLRWMTGTNSKPTLGC